MPGKYTHRKLSARYPTDLPAWKKLKLHFKDEMRQKHLRDLFVRSRNRAEIFSLEAGDLTLDYSKTHLSRKTCTQLVQLAKQAAVPSAIEAMFAGERINRTEDRSVLHVALRAKMADQVALDVTGVPDVFEVLTKIEEFVEDVHAGRIVGSTGKRFTDIVQYRDWWV